MELIGLKPGGLKKLLIYFTDLRQRQTIGISDTETTIMEMASWCKRCIESNYVVVAGYAAKWARKSTMPGSDVSTTGSA